MEHRERMVRSGRVSGAVGTKPTVVTQAVLQHIPVSVSIVDFGAGKFQQQTHILRDEGYDVYPHDLPENTKGWNVVDSMMPLGKCVVMLSNVLNVQEDMKNIAQVIIHAFNKTGASLMIANYPKEPRYSDVTFDEMFTEVNESEDYAAIKMIGSANTLFIWRK